MLVVVFLKFVMPICTIFMGQRKSRLTQYFIQFRVTNARDGFDRQASSQHSSLCAGHV